MSRLALATLSSSLETSWATSRFAVILGDDVIDAKPPALRQMIDVFDEVQGPVLAIERVPKSDVSSYGIIDADEIKPGSTGSTTWSRSRP